MGFFNNQGIGGAGGSSSSTPQTYTNATPMAATFRGFNAGDTFSAVPHNTLWDKTLYPYQSPAFTAFSISGQTSPLEVGASIASGAKTFTWTTSNSANVSPNTIKITDVTGGNIDLATLLANDSSEVINFASSIQKVTNTSHVWSITGTNTNLVNFSSTYTVNWYWRMWWGFLPQTSLVDADVLTLQSSKLATTKSGSITLPTNGGTNYVYIVYPDAWGLITQIQDTTNSFNVTSDYTNQGTLSHTNAFGVVNTMRIYRSNNATGGASGFNYTIT